MTPEEIDQLIGEKVAAAISAYAAAQNSGEGSKPVGGQNTAAKNVEGGRAEGKRKWKENHGKNLVQYPNKRQEMVKTDDAGGRYKGKLPYCGSCDKHHTGHCAMICNQCKAVGYMTRDYRNPTPITKAMTARNVMEYPNKRQEDDRTHGAGQKVRRRYLGNHPYCNRCGRHHPGRCTVVCEKCKKVGHMAKNCRVAAPMPNTAVPMTCYKCGATGHFKRNCPQLKKQTLKQPKEEPI